ncbi:hypothetical protein NL676_017148 [Syzygium grande]|nr:hypothetical protein NL676_017148 [Syzygium grande]
MSTKRSGEENPLKRPTMRPGSMWIWAVKCRCNLAHFIGPMVPGRAKLLRLSMLQVMTNFASSCFHLAKAQTDASVAHSFACRHRRRTPQRAAAPHHRGTYRRHRRRWKTSAPIEAETV